MLENVTFRYPGAPEPALRDASWTVPGGAFVLVAGRSASGKSTLLRCLNGLVPHFSGGTFGGTSVVAGTDTRFASPRDLSVHVGFVFQDPEAQLVTSRVADEIAFGLEHHGVARTTMRKRVEETLDLLGIAHLRDRRPQHLSGGERQRVAIAAALAMHPRLLVLDEPTSQLDPLAAEDVLAALTRLNEDLGLTVVVAEHRLERLLARADRVLTLAGADGVWREGTPRQIAAVLDPVALPPVTQVGRRIGHDPLPLTVKEGRALAVAVSLPDAPRRAPVPATGDIAIAAKGVTVRRSERVVLQDVSLDIHFGEFVALIGRNGGGKTTLLRALMGLEGVSRGKVTVGGVDAHLGDRDAIGRQIGYLPQQAGSLFFKERLIDELRFTIRARKGIDDTASMIQRFDLGDLVDRHPLDLSGGERERAALAAAMAGGPRILLLDEPTRGMDAWSKAGLGQLLRELQEEGVAIVMATHDMELVARVASRVVMLGDREIIGDGTPNEVLPGSLTFTTQINKIFGGRWLTVDEVAPDRARG
ncbi:MAG: Duplicated ATPase component CbrU of energizing module of predicted cobalamin ECF transporter [uncultured Thermomicrobiales bacterium]|uniref:Duplicated ATPase component CbrU of energizing module of predicted cobalamin ECF transporter n=1 Tax=uncultured Thermomicrobiales bacterium TaxID=1645740 RepID=A0A6J4UB18_9BACT|nr:MAG: Duplicated ATPase component CbrU of energizing module of predicted cobalamin ECF transporter [uncultured Thermomicrobiales bacterium]